MTGTFLAEVISDQTGDVIKGKFTEINGILSEVSVANIHPDGIVLRVDHGNGAVEFVWVIEIPVNVIITGLASC